MEFSGKKMLQATFDFNDKEVMTLITLGETSLADLTATGMSHECASLLHAVYWKVVALLDNPTDQLI